MSDLDKLRDLADCTHKIVLERAYAYTRRAIPCHMLLAATERAQVFQTFQGNMDALVFDLETYMHALADESIEIHRRWPKSWWDAFKLRWFPTFTRKWFPIDWERIDISEKRYRAVCPHMQDTPQETHVVWFHEQNQRRHQSTGATQGE